MAKQPVQADTTLQTTPPTDDSSAGGPQVPDFDFIDMLFGFPLAVSIAHAVFGTAGLAVGLTPVGLPVVLAALVLFVGQKSLRRDPGIVWKALEFGFACLPDTLYRVLPAPLAGLLESTEHTVAAHAQGDDADAKSADTTSEVQPGSTPTLATVQPTPSTPTTATNTLAMIDLATIAGCSTVLLVGSRGSGKSTLLRAILAARRDAVMVYDPHASPYDWPMAKIVHNSEVAISKGLASAYTRLQARKHERRTGVRLSGWAGLTLAADEWGSIVANVTLPDAIDKTPGEVSTELMKEGRKFDIGFVAGAHGKTNKSLGCVGDNEAFLQSFDWIINLGGFTRKMLGRDYAELFAQIPMGTNEQGSTFPLIVVCESPTTGELRLLDMRGLKTVDTSPRPSVVTPPWSQSESPPKNSLLRGLLAEKIVTNEEASLPLVSNDVTKPFERRTSDVTPVTNVTVTPQEVACIADQLARNVAPSDIAKRLKGYTPADYKVFKAKVDTVKQMLASEPPKDAAAATNDDPDPDIGPFGSMLGKE